MATDLALLRLLQLVSPGLPIGMYSYSQGLERAVDDGWIREAPVLPIALPVSYNTAPAVPELIWLP